jgi:hypothetical protein
MRPTLALLIAPLICGFAACSQQEGTSSATGGASLPTGLLVSMAVLDSDASGNPLPQPARLGFLLREEDGWTFRTLEDPDSNVFHKAMVYAPSSDRAGVLTLGGTRAILRLWKPDGTTELIWEKDFGGRFSRMRDAEAGDLYGDGGSALAVATHDQGVVAIVRPGPTGGYEVDELDEEAGVIVHEIEIGDLDGDGVQEVYATPSAMNLLDGTPQPGSVTRYVPATGEGREVVADLGDRHAKEILVDDVDGDGRDELYVVVEAVSGGRVEILRFDAGTDPQAGSLVAILDDTLCRFLTAGDVDGDGRKEMVAAARQSGLWLLRSGDSGVAWEVTSIDRDSGGFEHASILADLDSDGRDELYVASDDDSEIRRYTWHDGEPVREVIYKHADGLSRFTWNLMPVPVELIPATGSSQGLNYPE